MVTYGKELKFESTHRCPQSSYSRHVVLDEPCCSPAPCLCPAPTGPPDGAAYIPSFGTQISAAPTANFPTMTFILCPLAVLLNPGAVMGFRGEGTISVLLIDLGHGAGAPGGCSGHWVG